MKQLFGILIILISLTSLSTNNFKEEQKKYPRVRQAYTEKESVVLDLLKSKSISVDKLQVYIRIFKQEKKLELWSKNEEDAVFVLIKTYDVCQSSGVIGPKRKEGDLQVPEGYYKINMFNPVSNFYLSLGINYPNASDKILGVKGNLGGSIFIHGNCVTIGCVPITDDKIKELYILCLEAKNNGQTNIPVTIFPAELSDAAFSELKNQYSSDVDRVNLWTDLKAGYDYFSKTRNLPKVQFLRNGRHSVN
jgi:murein L,D-transpeptidase YafK